MKLFTTDDIRAIDRRTIESEGVTSRELISRVAEGVAYEITTRWHPTKRIVVFAGPGNNGADALAVVRLLLQQGYRPSVFLFNIGGNRLSLDCKEERDALLAAFPGVNLTEVKDTFNMPELTEHHLVIDGIFGSGLRDSLSGGFLALVRYINESKATVLSIDVPTGMFGDLNSNMINRNVIHASLTITIQFPRLAFFLRDNAELVGEWRVIDIGLSSEAIASTKTNYHLVEQNEVKNLLVPRGEFFSKADCGSALLIAGSYGMMGAAVLATRAACRSGAGKVTIHSAQCGYEVLQSAVPEALFHPDKHKIIISDMTPEHEYQGIGVGPGIGTDDYTINALDLLMKSRTKPLVIDADALNCIALRPTMLNHIPVLSVLTPHDGEFDRLFDSQPSSEARLLRAIEVANYHNILIILKGRYSALVRPDRKVYFNSSGTPAMATAGSGDVLTGLITGLMAQGYKPEVSAIIGMFVHGLAGEIAAEEQGVFGVTAGDIASSIGKAFKRIMK
ncbi:MAG: NAD(P)H-hydrate dehydratase [Bacteroidales bacterium]|nr:NAD(P)H-hydrate dehydratase [Bacteroidales bacterium]